MKDIKDYLAENPAFAASFVEVSTAAVVANPALASAMVQGTVAGHSKGAKSAQGSNNVPAWAKSSDEV